MTRLLFVCLGNICRSPLAEAVVREQCRRAGLDVVCASAGTADYHGGHGADPRALSVGREHGYDLSTHAARQVAPADFAGFDVLLAMDRANLAELERRCPARHRHKLALFLPFAGVATPPEVPDPYYGTLADFVDVLRLAEQGAGGLIRRYGQAHNAPQPSEGTAT